MSEMFSEFLKGHIIHGISELREMDTPMLEAVTEEFRCMVVCCKTKLERCSDNYRKNGEDVASLSWLMGEYARYMCALDQRHTEEGIRNAWDFMIEVCKLADPEMASKLFPVGEKLTGLDSFADSRMRRMKQYLENEEWDRKESYDEYYNIVNHWRDGYYAVDFETQHWLLMAWAKSLWPNRIR